MKFFSDLIPGLAIHALTRTEAALIALDYYVRVPEWRSIGRMGDNVVSASGVRPLSVPQSSPRARYVADVIVDGATRHAEMVFFTVEDAA